MTEEELLILYAKDRAINIYGYTILAWSKETWLATIERILEGITEDRIPHIKRMYPGVMS
jgi:hypothetical protein